jgi:hypothetical protein
VSVSLLGVVHRLGRLLAGVALTIGFVGSFIERSASASRFGVIREPPQIIATASDTRMSVTAPTGHPDVTFVTRRVRGLRRRARRR